MAELAVEIAEIAGYSHHGGVVGGEHAWRYEGREAAATTVVLDGLTHSGVGRDTAAYSHGPYTGGLDGFIEFVHEYVYDSGLERGGKVGTIVVDELRIGFEIVAQGV